MLASGAGARENCFVGISSQPGLGGPKYFIRNVMFNLTYSAFKLHRHSSGDVILHNTVVKAGDGLGNYTSEPFDHALFENNLFIGGKMNDAKFGGYSSGRGRAVDVQKFGDHVVFDHNGFGTHGVPFEGRIRSLTFTDIRENTFDPHGVEVDLNIFALPAFPDDPTVLYAAPDLRLRSNSVAVDAASEIPNVNDQLFPQPPDIGAYEDGQTLPMYGPRAFNVTN